MIDLVTPQLRQIEREVDQLYLANPLVKLPFAEAAWQVMAFFEDLAIHEVLRGPPRSHVESVAFFDYIINRLQYPLSWLYRSCSPQGSPSPRYNPDLYQASHEITEMADAYEAFASAFIYATRGVIRLQVEGRSIRLAGPFYADPRYDAYDRLALPPPTRPDFSQGNIITLIDKALTVRDATFSYPHSRRLILKSMRMLEPVILPQFELPETWVFPRYTLQQFRSAASLFITLAHIHFIAHLRAAQRGCLGGGYESSVLLLPRERLVWLLIRFAQLPSQVARSLVGDLTYGTQGILHPDPALQPLIPLNADLLALPPSLFIASSTERNFIALLNRLPNERKVYLGLVNQKEHEMRERIRLDANSLGLRPISASLPGRPDLPDIDMAIISDQEKVALTIELKWFIAPAEPREVLEKVEEIKRGIDQVLSLSDAFALDPRPFHQALSISADYTVFFLLASENSIGDETSQHPSVPVVNIAHFLRKLRLVRSPRLLMSWLARREYLPVEGVDFRAIEPNYTVGNWTLHWFALEVLLSGDYSR